MLYEALSGIRLSFIFKEYCIGPKLSSPHQFGIKGGNVSVMNIQNDGKPGVLYMIVLLIHMAYIDFKGLTFIFKGSFYQKERPQSKAPALCKSWTPSVGIYFYTLQHFSNRIIMQIHFAVDTILRKHLFILC